MNACNAKHRCNLGQLVLRREQLRAQRVVSFKPVVVGVVVAATSTSIEFNFIIIKIEGCTSYMYVGGAAINISHTIILLSQLTTKVHCSMQFLT